MNIDDASSVMVAELNIGHVNFTTVRGDLATLRDVPLIPVSISCHIIRVNGSFVLHGDNIIVDGVLSSADTRAPEVMQTYGLHFVDDADIDVTGARKILAVSIVMKAWKTTMENFPDWEARSLCVTAYWNVPLLRERIRDMEKRIAAIENMITAL